MTNSVSNFTDYKAHLRSNLTVHYNWIIFHIRNTKSISNMKVIIFLDITPKTTKNTRVQSFEN